MKIDAKTAYESIFPIYQQIHGAQYLWKVISDIANRVFQKPVDDPDYLRDFTYGLVTIIPVAGTIFNLFLYIVAYRNIETETIDIAPPESTHSPEVEDEGEEEIPPPPPVETIIPPKNVSDKTIETVKEPKPESTRTISLANLNKFIRRKTLRKHAGDTTHHTKL